MNTAKTHPLLARPRRLVAQRLDDEQRTVARFWRDLIRLAPGSVLLVFVLSALSALFEGSTMGVFLLALQALMGEIDTTSMAELGFVGDLVINLNLASESLFLVLVGLAVAFQLLSSGLEFGARLATAHFQALAEGDARRRLFQQFMTMRYARTRAYQLGDLTSYMEQTNYLSLVVQLATSILVQLFVVVVYVLLLMWLSWPLTLVAAGTAVLLSAFLSRIMRRARLMGNRFSTTSVELNARTVEFLNGLRLVLSFGREQRAMEVVDRAVEKSVHYRQRGLAWQATVPLLVDVITVLGVAGLLIGGYLFLDRDAGSLPRLITFLLILYRLLPRVRRINSDLGAINNYWPFIERLAGMLRTDDKEYGPTGGLPFQSLQEDIEFRDVSLRYALDGPWAVRHLSFRVPKGSMVALVGESGAGKTTTVDLLLRLYEPSEGRILADGQDLSQLDWQAWRSQIGVVSQETFILNASVRDNIAFGRLDASDEEVAAAARAANSHQFIMEMSDGYDTVVGDQGYRLSGGQRQRIAIARAILRDPDILILDEATSDLDSRSERLIQEAMDNLRSQRTVVAIAHRLSTIAMADQILVLEQGRLVEQGNHEELLALDGRYARLWALQSAGTRSGLVQEGGTEGSMQESSQVVAI